MQSEKLPPGQARALFAKVMKEQGINEAIIRHTLPASDDPAALKAGMQKAIALHVELSPPAKDKPAG